MTVALRKKVFPRCGSDRHEMDLDSGIRTLEGCLRLYLSVLADIVSVSLVRSRLKDACYRDGLQCGLCS